MLDLRASSCLARILRPLTATYMVIEIGYETYVAGPVCKAFAIPTLSGAFKFMSDTLTSNPSIEAKHVLQARRGCSVLHEDA